MEFGQCFREGKFGQRKFGQRRTYLSCNVKKLVCYQPVTSAGETAKKLFLKDGSLDWSRNESLCNLKQCCLSADYQQAASYLYPLVSAIHDYLLKFTTEEFGERYKWQLEWTSKSDILLHCFDLLKSPQAGCLVASLLLVTSTLEHILGDIFMACSEAVHCPSLLKDLLQTTELKSVLGETFMCCLEVYIGSPAGLNLRNLSWHGFLSDGELQPRDVSFLLMCVISLGEQIERKPETEIINLEQRPLITYDKRTLLQGIFPDVQTDNLAALFRTSSFVTSSMAEMWNLAIDLYHRERFGDLVMIMLPQLEHSLRRVYACCNNLPERLLTAESSEFYTTFNEILSPVLSDNSPNNLLNVIGPCFLEILLDVLVHQEGPRLRDHISHGEVDMNDFPKHLADHILSISIAFCQNFPSDFFPFLSGAKHCPKTSEAVQTYSSIYHPASCLRRECLSYMNELPEWKILPKPSDEDFVCPDAENLCHITSCETIIERILKNYDRPSFRSSQQLTEEHDFTLNETARRITLEILTKSKSPTLFRPRHELEIVALLRSVVNQCSQASKQMQHIAKLRYEEWNKKTLRSRQRQNYRRFWLHIPFIGKTMALFAVILVIELINIENITGQDIRQVKFLKRCLQYAENLSSLSSCSTNRWQECAEIGKLLTEHAQTYYENRTR